MTNFSLFKRLTDTGTITEPGGNPNSQYALPSSVHWMNALALRVKDQEFNFEQAVERYGDVSPQKRDALAENTIFEHLLLGIHQLSAMKRMELEDVQADVARVAVVAWYYGIYWGAKAMIAAQEGTVQDNHRTTGKVWHAQFASKGLAMHPFDLNLSTLVKKETDTVLDELRGGRKKRGLVDPITDSDDAYDALVAYLSGTTKWYREQQEEGVKNSKEFKDIRIKGEPVSNFLGTEARLVRDARLQKNVICFIHQAFRYRGKANYREGLFLAHGTFVEPAIRGYIRDMSIVLEAFLIMSGAFCLRHLGPSLWNDFLVDVEKNRAFSLSLLSVWKKS